MNTTRMQRATSFGKEDEARRATTLAQFDRDRQIDARKIRTEEEQRLRMDMLGLAADAGSLSIEQKETAAAQTLVQRFLRTIQSFFVQAQAAKALEADKTKQKTAFDIQDLGDHPLKELFQIEPHPLGKGSYGTVWKGRARLGNNKLGPYVALKQMHSTQWDYELKVTQLLLPYLRETYQRHGLLSTCQPNGGACLPSYGGICMPFAMCYDSQAISPELTFVLDLLDGDCKSLFLDTRNLSIQVLILLLPSIVLQILATISALHDAHVVHKDLKLDNFLYKDLPGGRDPSIRVFVSDLGLAQLVDEDRTLTVLMKKRLYAVDMFRIGACVFRPIRDHLLRHGRSCIEFDELVASLTPQLHWDGYGQINVEHLDARALATVASAHESILCRFLNTRCFFL